MISNLCLSTMYLSGQSQSQFFNSHLVLPGFILEVVLRLLGFFCMYLKMELLNITRDFKSKTNGNKKLPQNGS